MKRKDLELGYKGVPTSKLGAGGVISSASSVATEPPPTLISMDDGVDEKRKTPKPPPTPATSKHDGRFRFKRLDSGAGPRERREEERARSPSRSNTPRTSGSRSKLLSNRRPPSASGTSGGEEEEERKHHHLRSSIVKRFRKREGSTSRLKQALKHMTPDDLKLVLKVGMTTAGDDTVISLNNALSNEMSKRRNSLSVGDVYSVRCHSVCVRVSVCV